MARKSIVRFDAKKLVDRIFKRFEKEQTDRLIAYAIEKMNEIGNSIATAPFRNNLDRTGNLLDSLCWGVCHKGSVVKFGYYRSETAIEEAALHEYSRPMGESVNGHFLASQFIASYTPRIENGWEVFFAVLAPYWGYWEKGFVHISSNGYFQWQTMTHFYDIVKKDLKPSKVTFNTYIPN